MVDVVSVDWSTPAENVAVTLVDAVTPVDPSRRGKPLPTEKDGPPEVVFRRTLRVPESQLAVETSTFRRR